MTMLDDVVAQLKADEGLRLSAYRDSRGVLTIGYGRNLDVLTITPEQAERWLIEDLNAAYHALDSRCPWAEELDPARHGILLQMVFNLGICGFLGFRRMLTALQRRDFNTAALEILNSDAAKQAPNRYARFARVIREGQTVAKA
jgi:lysozyme